MLGAGRADETARARAQATRGGPTIRDKHQHAHFGLSSIWDRDPNHDVRGVKPQHYQGEQHYSYHYRASAFEDKSPHM